MDAARKPWSDVLPNTNPNTPIPITNGIQKQDMANPQRIL